MGIGALFEHENHRGTGLKLIADRFLLLIVRKMLDVTRRGQGVPDLPVLSPELATLIHGKRGHSLVM